MRLILLAILLVLSACALPNPVPQSSRPLGLLEVNITGLGEGASPTATARWVELRQRPGVGSQTLTVHPVNGTAAVGDIQITRRTVSFLDHDLLNQRLVLATFDLVNRKNVAFSNLSFFAVNVPGSTQGGTGVVQMRDGNDALITDETRYRELTPAHAMRPITLGLEVNPTLADLQLFTPAEASSAETQGKTDPPGPANPILPADATVLEYGFVARNLLGGRGIAARNINAPGLEDCTVLACKGAITLAYRLPRISPRRLNPFTFTLYFLVADESETQVSQSLEEQPGGTAAGLSNLGAFAQVKTLAGSSIVAGDNLNPLGQVRIAVGTVLNPSNIYFPTLPPATPGSLDQSFGGSGVRTTHIGDDDHLRDLVMQSDGKIVGVGHSELSPGDDDVVVLRYNPNGSLDTGFGGDGKVTTSFGNPTDIGLGVAVQSDGKIVICGMTSSGVVGVGQDVLVARYNPDGALDTTFSGDGKTTFSIGTTYDWATDVAIQSDGKIVVGGWGTGAAGDTDFTLARLDSNGNLDTTFDGDGKVLTNFSGVSDDRINRITIQPDGKIVVAGFSDPDNNPATATSDLALARYNSDGSLDTSFDGDGKAATDFGLPNAWANDLALDAGGKVVVAGFADTDLSASTNYDFVVARFDSTGTLDTGFDGDGWATTDMGSSSDSAAGVVIQSDGKIVLGGDSNGDFAVARYTSTGGLDSSFDTDGKAFAATPILYESAFATALQADGKIVVAGSYGFGALGDVALVRFNP